MNFFQKLTIDFKSFGKISTISFWSSFWAFWNWATKKRAKAIIYSLNSKWKIIVASNINKQCHNCHERILRVLISIKEFSKILIFQFECFVGRESARYKCKFLFEFLPKLYFLPVGSKICQVSSFWYLESFIHLKKSLLDQLLELSLPLTFRITTERWKKKNISFKERFVEHLIANIREKILLSGIFFETLNINKQYHNSLDRILRVLISILVMAGALVF